MMVCEHFSQRSTCPPSAAVRQRSMADITFNWSRLTWPALANTTPPRGRGRYPRPPASDATRLRGAYAGGGSVLVVPVPVCGAFCWGFSGLPAWLRQHI